MTFMKRIQPTRSTLSCEAKKSSKIKEEAVSLDSKHSAIDMLVLNASVVWNGTDGFDISSLQSTSITEDSIPMSTSRLPGSSRRSVDADHLTKRSKSTIDVLSEKSVFKPLFVGKNLSLGEVEWNGMDGFEISSASSDGSVGYPSGEKNGLECYIERREYTDCSVGKTATKTRFYQTTMSTTSYSSDLADSQATYPHKVSVAASALDLSKEISQSTTENLKFVSEVFQNPISSSSLSSHRDASRIISRDKYAVPYIKNRRSFSPKENTNRVPPNEIFSINLKTAVSSLHSFQTMNSEWQAGQELHQESKHLRQLYSLSFSVDSDSDSDIDDIENNECYSVSFFSLCF